MRLSLYQLFLVILVTTIAQARNGYSQKALDQRITISFTNLTVVEAAKEASKTGSSTQVNLLFGALAGLVLGVLGAIVRDRLDSKAHTPDDVEETGLPVLCEPPNTATNAWVDGDDRVEAFRRLRMSVGEPGSVITVVGVDSQEAAFSAAVDLSRAAGEAGNRVLLVNADMRTGQNFGTVPSSHSGLADLLREPEMTIAIAERLPTWNNPAINILGAGVVPPGTTATALLASGHLPKVLESLRGEFDLVVVYAAPVLNAADAAIVSAASDGALLVIEASYTTKADLETSVATLRGTGARTLGAILTTRRRSTRVKGRVRG